jgi:son of sevenless-like protein
MLEERSAQTRTMIIMAENVWSGAQHFVKTMAGLERDSSGRARESLDITPLSLLESKTSPAPLLVNNLDSFIVIRSPSQLSELLTSMHDQLLSTIAAFIGHVHAHTRSSHSSSYAYLIDMTRETIERVREILVVVEAVMASPLFIHRSAGELETSRETLYVATTSLVTAARVATSAPEIESKGGATEDEEKRTLLQSATSVLRSGGECIASIKKILARRPSDDKEDANRPFELALPQLVQTNSTISLVPPSPDQERRGSSATSSTANSPVNEYASMSEVGTSSDGLRGRSGTASSKSSNSSGCSSRGSHTLSMLGRKATSLSCLQDMYEAGSRACSAQEKSEVHQLQSQSLHPSLSQLDTRRPSIPEDALSPESSRLDLKLDSRFTAGPTSTSMIVQRSAPNFGGGSASNPISISTRPAMHHRTSSRTSSRMGGPPSTTTSVAMSRNESSRTSESSRSTLSRNSTTPTSPRTSTSTAPDQSVEVDPDVTLLSAPNGRLDVYSSQSTTSNSTITELSAPISDFPSHISRLPVARRPSGPLPSKEGTAWYLARDYEAQEIAFNGDGHVTGGTLKCLIERMTLHDTTIDLTFSNTFFLTFRMFTTPLELSQALYRRYDITPFSGLHPDELREWNASKATPVRLRIYNFFKTWLESYWQAETDGVVLDSLLLFCQNRVAGTMASASQRLVDLAQKRMRSALMNVVEPLSPTSPLSEVPSNRRGLMRTKSSEKMKAGKIVEVSDPYLPLRRSGPAPPSPSVSKTLLQQLRSLPASAIGIMDVDPLELARQLTIMESRLYCAIKPDELVGQDFISRAGKNSSMNIKAMSSLSTRITGWISEIILKEQDARKRTSLIKYFIKLSEVRYRLIH